VDYHGSIATFGPGGRGQRAVITVCNNGARHAAISMTHLNFSKQTYEKCSRLGEKRSHQNDHLTVQDFYVFLASMD